MSTERTKPSDKPAIFSTQVSDARYYYLNLDPPCGATLTVVCGGCERCDPDYEIRRSGFPYSGLEFVAEGRGALTLGKRHHDLRPGMVFSYGPDTSCRIRNDPDAPMLKYFIDFVGNEGTSRLAATPVGIGQAAQMPAIHEAAELFEMLQREAGRGTAGAHDICAMLLRVLFIKLQDAVPPDTGVASQAAATYRRCRHAIDERYLELDSLADIADCVHLDPSYVCRLFRHYGQTTPYAYLVYRKMTHAAQVLLSAGMLVKEVAADMGFSDPYHFSRLFKACHGVSPRRFIQIGTRGRVKPGQYDPREDG